MSAYEATLTSKGQLTMPVEVRTKLGLKEGDKVEFYFDPGQTYSSPAQCPSVRRVRERPQAEGYPQTHDGR